MAVALPIRGDIRSRGVAADVDSVIIRSVRPFLTLAGFCFFKKTTCMQGWFLTEVSKPLGILPSRTAPLRQFRIDHNTDSIFIKEPV